MLTISDSAVRMAFFIFYLQDVFFNITGMVAYVWAWVVTHWIDLNRQQFKTNHPSILRACTADSRCDVTALVARFYNTSSTLSTGTLTQSLETAGYSTRMLDLVFFQNDLVCHALLDLVNDIEVLSSEPLPYGNIELSQLPGIGI